MSDTKAILAKQTVRNEQDESVRLNSLWESGAIVLVFVRHFG